MILSPFEPCDCRPRVEGRALPRSLSPAPARGDELGAAGIDRAGTDATEKAMSTTVRLNQTSRQTIIDEAKRRLVCQTEQAAETAAFEAARDALATVLTLLLPVDELAVLKSWHATSRIGGVEVQLPYLQKDKETGELIRLEDRGARQVTFFVVDRDVNSVPTPHERRMQARGYHCNRRPEMDDEVLFEVPNLLTGHSGHHNKPGVTSIRKLKSAGKDRMAADPDGASVALLALCDLQEALVAWDVAVWRHDRAREDVLSDIRSVVHRSNTLKKLSAVLAWTEDLRVDLGGVKPLDDDVIKRAAAAI